MTEQFKREERYIVIKRKNLTEKEEFAIRALLEGLDVGTVECVVVESDWPENEIVWKMIEARVTDQPVEDPRDEALRLAREALENCEGMVDELRDYPITHDLLIEALAAIDAVLPLPAAPEVKQ